MGSRADMFVDKYKNKGLKKVATADLEGIELLISRRSRSASYEFARQDSDDNLYVYFSEFVKGVNSLYRLKLNNSSFKFEDEELIYRDKKANKRLDRRATFAVVESEDKNKFAIYSFVNEKLKSKNACLWCKYQ